ncbi:uncharacterized protein Bfra_007783 [Botrytis fragariae]|uniref:Uncharacterized protein n=1 Tax=Botrytis fragariae TaxID=1964551 RepID=A0A8H6ANZ7_9HELO|nr:uncharacterized protein Bfra_007783 [Botrytis fragariae]KAF5871268.1 hypothetical protein Bfra_007783 [Botrytis fragariae]
MNIPYSNCNDFTFSRNHPSATPRHKTSTFSHGPANIPRIKNDTTRLNSKKIPSKVCSSKLRSRLVTSPSTQDDETANTSEEELSSRLERSSESTCSGGCGKIGGCERKEKSVSLEF